MSNPDDLAGLKPKSYLYLSEVYLDHNLLLCDDPSCKGPSHIDMIHWQYKCTEAKCSLFSETGKQWPKAGISLEWIL